MARTLCLALALVVLAPVAALAQETTVSQDPAVAVAETRARYDACEAAYARIANGALLSSQLQKLAASGNAAQVSQLLETRTRARLDVEAALAAYLVALKAQGDDAPTVLVAIQGLRTRLQDLAADSVNEKLAALGVASVERKEAKEAPAVVANVSVARAPAPVAPVAATKDDEKPAALEQPTTKARPATGRLVIVAADATPEQREHALELLRAGKAPEKTDGELYLVERWREKTPTWVRLARDDAHGAELARLAREAGATCSVAGTIALPAPAKGEVVFLHDWKVTALSTGERLGSAPRTAKPEKPSSNPGPLAAEEENFDD
jgi:hypothetical protein